MNNKTDITPSDYLQTATPSFEAGVIAEPLLLFGGHRSHIDPKTGLSLYGPYTVSDQERPPVTSIIVGFVGPATLLAGASNWIAQCRSAVLNDGSQPFLYPHFPGFSAEFPFQCGLTLGDSWREIVSESRM